MTKPLQPFLRRLAALPTALLLGLVRLYQRLISPVLPAVFGPGCACRFYPTCSHYASEALRTHGALYGSWLAIIRLLKCTPLHPGGLDPVPPRRRSRPRCTRVTAPTRSIARARPGAPAISLPHSL